jgi:K+-transporting ATPase ATPase C chain
MTMLKNQLRPAILLTLLLCLITGFVYPGVITTIAQVLFPHQANGSLITTPDGTVIGSELIGQQFARAEYFHSRPSAAGSGYDDTLSAGRNKGPTDLKLADTMIAQAVDSTVRLDGAVPGQIPSDLVTASGSGVDPHLSPASAFLQVARVAQARGVDAVAVRTLVERHVEGRQLGFFGEPRVNVLLLNLDLDRTLPSRKGTTVR